MGRARPEMVSTGYWQPDYDIRWISLDVRVGNHVFSVKEKGVTSKNCPGLSKKVLSLSVILV